MAEAMQNTGKAMMKMNKAINVPTVTKMMAEFERENARTEMMQEVLGDAIDDALEEDGTADEEDRVVNQILDEIGIDFGEELPDAGIMSGVGTPAAVEASSSSPAKVATAAGGGGGGPSTPSDDPALSELEARLNNLKR